MIDRRYLLEEVPRPSAISRRGTPEASSSSPCGTPRAPPVARGGHAVANQQRQSGVLWLLLVVFGVSALAYFVAPAASLRVVGMASDHRSREATMAPAALA